MRWLLLVLGGCGFEHGFAPGGGSGSQDDAGASDGSPGDIDAAPDDALALGPWGNVVPVFPNAVVGDDDPTATADLRELYFNRNADIYVTKRSAIGQPWGNPTLVTEVSDSTFGETTPEITSDGLTMFIGSARTGSIGAGDIWMSTRATRTDAWGTPTRIAALSTVNEDAAAAPTDDLKAIVMIGTTGTDVDLLISTRGSASGTWATPTLIDNVNSTAGDYSPMLSQDKKTLYFDSLRGASDDLYVATRTSATGTFATPAMISELSDPVAQETDPWVSPDGHHMFFVRDAVLYEASR